MRRPAAARAAAVGLLAGAWLLATAAGASAHAVVRSSDPANGATLDRAPHVGHDHLTEVPDASLSSIRVLDTAGWPVQAGSAAPVPGNPRQLRVALAGGLGDGTYTVGWRTLSRAHGHVTAQRCGS